MTELVLENISKEYEEGNPVLKDINLKFNEDDFVVILGPSGCGKSTLLRIISGLVEPSCGKVYKNGIDITQYEPKERQVGFVFQNYGLYPHMSVYKNMSFALEIKKLKKNIISEIVLKNTEMLGISGKEYNKPHELSGGERQRVAIGRATANKSDIYLFDEPLSNIDSSMKNELITEIYKLFKKINSPFIYVTHDQIEAMTLATRLVILNDGIVQQEGSVDEVYNYPQNMFVAEFLGNPNMNFFNCKVKGEDKKNILNLELDNTRLTIGNVTSKKIVEKYLGTDIILGIRSHDLMIVAEDEKDDNTNTCTLVDYEYLGNKIYLYGEIGNQKLTFVTSPYVNAKLNEEIYFNIDFDKVHFFDSSSENRISKK